MKRALLLIVLGWWLREAAQPFLEQLDVALDTWGDA